jgi:hypothetical protein
MSKRWNVSLVESNPESQDYNESTLFLTINPNQMSNEEDIDFMKDVMSHMLDDNLDKIVHLVQGGTKLSYEDLEEYMVGNIKVDVKYEVGSRYNRAHVHVKLQCLLKNRGSMMHLDLAKVRAFLKEQYEYNVYVEVRAVQNSNFNIDRYISK